VTCTGELLAPTTSFVGRETELADVEELLKRSRLVTLTGAGGVGKTRLALRVAARVRAAFPDGVWSVQLSPLQDPALLGHTVAEALGVVDHVLRPQAEVLGGFLARRRVLLVFDTCEHLVDACADLAETLLKAAPELRILATSRQPLDVPAERVLVLQPLQPSDAVELFRARAAEVPGYRPADKDHDVVTTLCRRLDGLPLAIELAAVRLGSMTVSQILARLEDRFELFGTDARRAVPSRHQTLRTTVGWSHELCEPLERLLWARLSVFAGDFDLEAAEQVCSDFRLPAAFVSALLLELVDKSIVVRTETATGARYGLLDLVRAYGAEWLRELGEESAVRRRHRDYYLVLARRGAAEWLGPDQVAWRERAVREHNNFRAALDFCLAAPEGHFALELAAALWFLWFPCGFQRDGRHYLQRALAQDGEPSPARTEALLARCRVAWSQGDYTESLLTEYVAAAADQGDIAVLANVHFLTGGAAFMRGDLARAVVEARHAVELERRRGVRTFALLDGLGICALALVAQGELDRAVALLEEMRAECDACGELWMRSTGDYVRARAELARGDIEAAVAYGRAALGVKHRLHDRVGMSTAIDLLAGAAAAAGDGRRAARLLGLGHQVWRTFGLPQLGAPEFVAGRALCERRARAAIGDEAYKAAFQLGLDSEVGEGVSYALGRTD
jgi:predicted ATPase